MFSHKIPVEAKATSQQSSGRCWIFAGLNVMRLAVADVHKVHADNFELSQNYVFFWDKFEKCNYVLEIFLDTIKTETPSGRLWQHVLSTPIIDGGQYDMFINVVEKYGVVPKSVYPDVFDATESRHLNWLLNNKLRETASYFYTVYHREIKRGKSHEQVMEELREYKRAVLGQIFQTMTVHLQVPPRAFDWRFKTSDKDKSLKTVRSLTPQEFYKQYCPTVANDISIINDPRNPYQKCYTVQYLGNVWGKSIRYLNLPIENLIDLVKHSIIVLKRPVWFGCDSGKYIEREAGIFDTAVYDYSQPVGTNVGRINSSSKDIQSLVYTPHESVLKQDEPVVFDKKQRLLFGESLMTHAMVFTGVDLDEHNNPTRFRIENSWGEKYGDKGYYSCSVEWFKEYVYQIVLPKDVVSESGIDFGCNIEEVLKEECTVLPLWDPMGALAE